MDDVAAQHGALGSDELIAGVARLLKEALPAHAMCGRIATDEFAVILTASPHIDAEAVIRTALESIARPHWLDSVVRINAHANSDKNTSHPVPLSKE